MKESQKQNWQTHDALDRALDAALAKYAAVEPRTGLEDRILANLRVEQEHAPNRGWWYRNVAAVAVAAMVLVISGLAWRAATRRAPTIADRTPAMAPSVELSSPQIASTRPPDPDSMSEHTRRRSHSAAPANPKLDQFPSPQPLSDQENLLARYVDAFPEHAVLLARARTEALQRDQIEETRLDSQRDGATDSDDRNRDRNNDKRER
jgi:hypothetical protein